MMDADGSFLCLAPWFFRFGTVVDRHEYGILDNASSEDWQSTFFHGIRHQRQAEVSDCVKNQKNQNLQKPAETCIL